MKNILKHIETLRVISEDLIPVSRAKIAAMIVYKGKVISIGVCQWKSHPFAAKYSKHPEAIWLHAEADAIFKAKRKLGEAEFKKSTLIIVRTKQDADGSTTYGISKPCAGCEKCIAEHGIKTVIYTETTKDAMLAYTTVKL
jgi:deoxycytidylate deaminase